MIRKHEEQQKVEDGNRKRSKRMLLGNLSEYHEGQE